MQGLCLVFIGFNFIVSNLKKTTPENVYSRIYPVNTSYNKDRQSQDEIKCCHCTEHIEDQSLGHTQFL